MKRFSKVFIQTLVVIFTASLTVSCGAPKKFVYLNDMVPGEQFDVNTESATIVRSNDILKISVSCRNPELAIPFNTLVNGSFQVSLDGQVNAVSGAPDSKGGYRVDSEGNIIFPILGKIHVADMTLMEVADMIEDTIKKGNYIKDPKVSIEFLNFKYTVLGAVNSKGTYSVDGDRITLIEAIARAGDLAQNARLDRVAVIRNVNGKQEIFYNDITKSSIFVSPTYYLQQNDIVYVEPRYRDRSASDKAWQISSFVVSLASMAATLIYAITALKGL